MFASISERTVYWMHQAREFGTEMIGAGMRALVMTVMTTAALAALLGFIPIALLVLMLASHGLILSCLLLLFV